MFCIRKYVYIYVKKKRGFLSNAFVKQGINSFEVSNIIKSKFIRSRLKYLIGTYDILGSLQI